jgi:Mor family transcriptional regulator
MKTDTPKTDELFNKIWLFTNEHEADEALCDMRDLARQLERENARLRELITLLEIAGEGMSEECASQPHVAKWDAARGEVGLFLRSA